MQWEQAQPLGPIDLGSVADLQCDLGQPTSLSKPHCLPPSSGLVRLREKLKSLSPCQPFHPPQTVARCRLAGWWARRAGGFLRQGPVTVVPQPTPGVLGQACWQGWSTKGPFLEGSVGLAPSLQCPLGPEGHRQSLCDRKSHTRGLRETVGWAARSCTLSLRVPPEYGAVDRGLLRAAPGGEWVGTSQSPRPAQEAAFPGPPSSIKGDASCTWSPCKLARPKGSPSPPPPVCSAGLPVRTQTPGPHPHPLSLPLSTHRKRTHWGV